MLKMVVPESVVLTECMQVGTRHLQDAGYGQTADQAEGDESNLSVEQKLAPWITTKNFLAATQAKAMLRLHGDGDPTGRGEAFSFIRISMKDIFVRAGEDYEQKLGKTFPQELKLALIRVSAEAESRPKSAHRYNVAEQQLIYKSEIERIWKAQFDSLSRKDKPELSDEEEEAPKPQKIEARNIGTRNSESVPPPNGNSMSPPPALTADAPSPAFSRGSSLERDRERTGDLPESTRRVLRIKRFVRYSSIP